MTKMTNRDLIVTTSVGLLATIILVVVFQNSFGGKKVEREAVKNVEKVEQATTTDKQVAMEIFKDEGLGIAFQYPKGLKIVTDGKVVASDSQWLEVSSISVDDALKDDYWKEKLNKLAMGEVVVLPGDIYIKKTSLQASAGSYPVSIYTEVSLKNCQENYANKLIALIADKIVILNLQQSPVSVANELKELKATSTAENMDCNNGNLDIYNADLLIEKIKNNSAGENILSGLQAFRTILSTIVIDKIKTEPVASSTPATIKAPTINNDGNISVEIDRVVYLFGDEAEKQMKKDNVCKDSCKVPEAGYLSNQTKKYASYDMDFNSFIAINYSSSTSTPPQSTQISLPGLVDFLKQGKTSDGLVFDIYFDDKGKSVIGLKQR